VSGLTERLRRWSRDERGLSLPELLVATFVFGVVSLIFTSTMASVQGAVVHQENLSRTNDQARLALEQLDREIRSGNVLYDPANESTAPYEPYYTLRIYTQSNADTRGSFSCVLWTIDDAGQLLTRRWPPGDPGSATAWRVVATGIVNKELAVPAFVLDPDPLKGSRTLDVALRVNENMTRFPDSTIELTQSLTGRNTSYGYPVTVCQSTPPY
jgi:prepilin-type N-terminal cleavage/methylation domain-containing protein